MTDKATFEDFCVWLRCVSDAEPTQRRFSALSVSDLQTVKSEADRIRRICAEHDARVAKAKRMAARVK